MSYSDPVPIKTIPLESFFTKTNDRLNGVVDKIRASDDKAVRDALKSKLPAITVSGCFSYRRLDFQISHSGFICMDIDGLNQGDVEAAKRSLQLLPYACIISKSVSQRGVFFIAEVSQPEFHKEHFDWIALDVKQKLGFEIDRSCSDPSRLRGYTVDEDIIIKRNAEIVQGRHVEPHAIRELKNEYGSGLDRMRFFQLLRLIEESGVDITQFRPDWIKIGTGIASEFGEEGYAYFEAISCNYKNFKVSECKKQWRSCLKGREKASLNSVFWIAKNYGVMLK